MEDKHECKVCCELINKNAKKCPHCLEWQTKSGRLKVILILLFIVTTPFFIMQGWQQYEMHKITKMQKKYSALRKIDDYTDKITIKDIEFKSLETEKTKSLLVSAIIVNQTEINWGGVSIKVKVYSKSDKLIDSGYTFCLKLKANETEHVKYTNETIDINEVDRVEMSVEPGAREQIDYLNML
jgi:hypothetical protein